MISAPFQRLQGYLWNREPGAWPARLGLQVARYALALLRDLFAGELSLRAMSLVYTSLLSLVPLLALAFSVLKAFGVHDALISVLTRFFAPLGPEGMVLARRVAGFVDNMKIGVLGSVGVGLLVYTAISLIHKVEASFNFAWGIGRGRALQQRFGDYMSVLIVGPLLVFSALGLTATIKNSHVVASLMRVEPFGSILVSGFKLMPYALIWAAFSFLYAFIPNTRVRAAPALIAGLCAGVAWQAASAVFATFVANAGNYNAVYSSFAILIFLLIWLYVGWQVLLLGCRLTFYLQHPQRLRAHAVPEPGSREREVLALAAVAVVGARFVAGRPPVADAELARELGVMPSALARALAPLLGAGVLAQGADGALLLARDPQSIDLRQLWLTARGQTAYSGGQAAARACELLAALETDSAAAAGRSLRDWLA
ncbi:MAG: YihY/virulence factor BrkB family protein [Gammaproteobacteria bacterium]|nr:YihY/virulence factor BrkB family protein [Gammaproteobacteria bacterium]